MNYYEHHIGDYAQATAHLSFVEDAAYGRLIRKYYAEEKPLPPDLKAVQRLTGARTREEREAVDTVLNEFFTLEADGWHNKRCDAEIARYHEGYAERAEKKANENERMRRHREERARLFAELRDLGITPKWDATVTQLRGLLKSECNGPATRTGMLQERNENGPATANQTPDTRHQTPDVNSVESTSTTEPLSRGDPSPPSPRNLQVIERLSFWELERGVKPRAITTTDPRIAGWVQSGVTDEQLREAYRLAAQARADRNESRLAINPGFLDAFLAEILNPKGQASAVIPINRVWHDSNAEVETRGAALGLSWLSYRERGQNWPAYKADVVRAVEQGAAA